MRKSEIQNSNFLGLSPWRGRGFTLIELMVAVGVTVILVIAVARIFAVATEAVGKGMGISEILGNSRIIGDQIARDFEEMVGPAEGGVMVIVNQTISAAVIADDVDSGFKKDCRSDQIMFIRRRGNLEPLAPSSSTSYSNSSTANYVKLWLGHLKRANSDGSEPSGSLGTAPNQLAGSWMLGRNALFLQSDPPTGGVAHADGGAYKSVVSGYGGSYGSAPGNVYGGLIDVAEFGLVTESANGAMVGQNEDDAGDTNTGTDSASTTTGLKLYVKNAAGSGSFPSNTYRDRVYDYIFVKQRLLANPFPDGNGYESWRIAQMHPILATGVSEIRIEFAGDFNNDGKIDEVASGNGIQWYGKEDTAAGVKLPPESAGGFTGAGQAPIIDKSPASNGASLLNDSNNDVVFIFRHGTGPTDWPYLIRIRFRLHDGRDRIADADGEFGRWFEQIMAVNRDG